MLKKLAKILMCCALLLISFGCQYGQGQDETENTEAPSFDAVTKLADLKDIAEQKKVIVEAEMPHESSSYIQKVDELPEFSVESLQGIGWDLRSLDLSKIDLSDNKNLVYASFNDKTIWPDQCPEYFDPTRLLEEGKNPGLGIRAYHEQGITGKGVNIAIIDQTLDVNHQEYAEQLMLYEKINVYQKNISMHGPAVSSLAVGKSIGTAPEADLYYIACDFYDLNEGYEMTINFNYLAAAVNRVVEINDVLPEDDKIRVLSISRGYSLGEGAEIGSDQLYEAIEKAKEKGIFVITTSSEMNYDFKIYGLGRKMNEDADVLESYTKGLFWQSFKNILNHINNGNTLLVPMDQRTTASMSGDNSYEYSSNGGLSWAVPWLAGMYALCVQIDPDIAPDTFIRKAVETGDVLKLEGGKEIKTVVNPQRLIQSVQAAE